MRITIAAVGLRQPGWADAAVADFLKRFPAGFAVELRAVKAAPREGQPVERIRRAEAERLRAALPPRATLVALDERGRDLDTAGLAAELTRWSQAGEPLAFLIGGPDGLDPQLLREARQVVRLSSLTLPHALARVVLVEALYRAWSLSKGHPYHRE